MSRFPASRRHRRARKIICLVGRVAWLASADALSKRRHMQRFSPSINPMHLRVAQAGEGTPHTSWISVPPEGVSRKRVLFPITDHQCRHSPPLSQFCPLFTPLIFSSFSSFPVSYYKRPHNRSTSHITIHVSFSCIFESYSFPTTERWFARPRGSVSSALLPTL